MTAISPPAVGAGTSAGSLSCHPVPFERIPRRAWDRLFERTPAAPPFARWTVHRAWWDAYGPTAHEQYLVAAPTADAPADEILGIVPLMHRHMAEPQDEPTATILRRTHVRGTRIRPDAKAVFFGASYHCDYATILADPQDLPAVARATAGALAAAPDPAHGDQPWDVIDLRRLRATDPALTELEAAFRERAAEHGWQVIREREDVSPVVTFDGADWDGYLATLSKKARHEIRRKLRRAEAHGTLVLRRRRPTADAIARFVELHAARFGEEGLFPSTEGGRRSRRFVERMGELELAEVESGGRGLLEVIEVRSGERLIFAALAFDDGGTCYLYNAGMDPAAADLSPGVTGTAALLRDCLEHGRRRFDFLRGDEPYKYQWGARNEPVERLLVLSEPLVEGES